MHHAYGHGEILSLARRYVCDALPGVEVVDEATRCTDRLAEHRRPYGT